MPRESTDWEAIKQEFITGECSLNALGRLHGKSSATMSGQSKKGGWLALREQYRAEVSACSLAHIKESAIKETVSLYEKTREAATLIIDSVLRAAKDSDGFFRHVVQEETEFEEIVKASKDHGPGTKSKTRHKWVEDKILETINGRNAADSAKALKDLTQIARTLDDIVDAAVKQKLEIEREKLELDKRKSGMSDDMEQESGIAYMPGQDISLMEDALPDPDDDHKDGAM